MVKKTTTIRIGRHKYAENFKNKEEKALEKALDVRKFEIELYWKRAAYFWTFIGATFAGFLAIQISSTTTQNKEDLSILVTCFGIVFSFAWLCVNKGSKFWQENWEKHVDVLEDSIIGPLYKTVLSRNIDDFTGCQQVANWITGPGRYSVSKINQIVNFFVFILWIILLLNSLSLLDFFEKINLFHFLLIFFTVMACVVIGFGCKSYTGGCWHIATLRKSRIKPNNKL